MALQALRTTLYNLVTHVSLFGSSLFPSFSGAVDYSLIILCFISSIHLRSGCTSLHSHQQWRSIPLALHLLHKLSAVFVILAILTGVQYNCIYVEVSDPLGFEFCA
ncbi:hypothetical protein STEG23_015327, partial [Scotinomys teguina]